MSDFLSRVTIPDIYPRQDDPFRPPNIVVPGQPPAQLPSITGPAAGFLPQTLTTPGQRPYTYQKAINLQVNVGTTPTPILNQRFECDSMVLDNLSTAANSVFFGYSNNVSLTNGIEIRAGLPVIVAPENTREQWELQRMIEAIAAMMANDRGIMLDLPYKAPRVVFDASSYFLIASAATTISVMLFYIPDQQ